MRFSLEPSKPLIVLGEFLGKNLDGDIASELRVPSAVDFAHGPGSEWSDNLVGAETSARAEAHVGTSSRWNLQARDKRSNRTRVGFRQIVSAEAETFSTHKDTKRTGHSTGPRRQGSAPSRF